MQLSLSKLGPLLKQAFSEHTGRGSCGRISAGVIIANVIAWVGYLILTGHGIPDLAGPIRLLTSGVSATYGANKVSAAIKGTKDKQDGADETAEGGKMEKGCVSRKRQQPSSWSKILSEFRKRFQQQY